MPKPLTTRLLSLVCALAATHLTGAQVQQPQPATPTAFVLGTVVDADSGRPVPDVVVRFSNDQQSLAAVGLAPVNALSPHTAVADGQGRFLLRAVPKGSYSLSTTAPGYVNGGYGQRKPNGPQRQVQVEDGQALSGVTVRIWKFATLSGTILDEAGEPAVGVSVRALRRAFTGGKLRLSSAGVQAASDDRGIFRITSLLPGDYLVAAPSTVASAPTALVDSISDADRTSVMYQMMTFGTGGSALLNSGVRVGDTQISPSGSRGALTAPEPVANRGLEIYPTVYHPNAGTAAQARVITLASGEERSGVDLQLRLVSGHRISGTVVGPDGPLPMTALRLVPAAIGDLNVDSGFETATTLATPDGRFTFPVVPVGDYVIRVLRAPRAPAPASATQMTVMQVGGTTVTSFSGSTQSELPTEPTLWADRPVTVADRDVSEVSIVLNRGARVSGHVQFEGSATPPPPERLSALGVSLARADGLSTTGFPFGRVTAEGQFRTTDYPPGKYLIAAGAPGPPWTVKSITIGSVNALEEPFDLGSEDITTAVVTFTDRASTLEGSVRAEGRAGDPEAIVIAFPADWKGWIESGMPARRLRQAAAQANGTYRLGSMVAGEFLVVAVPADTAQEPTDPAFIATLAQRATRVTVSATGATTLALTVARLR
jgi:hypothetical protein